MLYNHYFEYSIHDSITSFFSPSSFESNRSKVEDDKVVLVQMADIGHDNS